MKVFWEPAFWSGGTVHVIDVPSRGMLYLTSDVPEKKCPTCGHVTDHNPPGRRRLRWLSHDARCEPKRFYPRWMYLPPELEPLGRRPELRVRMFLQRAVKLLKREKGTLFVWWKFEDVLEDGHFQTMGNETTPLPKGRYLVLSPYWVPKSISEMIGSMSQPPGDAYPKRI